MPDWTYEIKSIFQEAKELYNEIKLISYPKDLAPSVGWNNFVDTVLHNAIYETTSLIDSIYYIQAQPIYVIPHNKKGFIAHRLIARYQQWLRSQGTPLSSFDDSIQESLFTNPNFTINQHGKTISTMFLWYLCTSQRILKNVKGPINNILEIGGGYGGLARLLKLFLPKTRYFFLDQLRKSIKKEFQYPRSPYLKGFLIRRLKQGINTFADFPAREFIGGGTCDCAISLDPYWRVHLWDIFGKKAISKLRMAIRLTWKF